MMCLSSLGRLGADAAHNQPVVDSAFTLLGPLSKLRAPILWVSFSLSEGQGFGSINDRLGHL